MKKTGLKKELLSFVFIALMLCSIFVGAVSAENASVDLSDNAILNETGNLETFNSSDNYSLSSEIDSILDSNKPVLPALASTSNNIVINEIMFNPVVADSGKEWIEIYNGNATININGWTISNRTGAAVATLPNWNFPTGTYLVVHFGSGTNDNNFTNGTGHFYTNTSIEVFNNTEDECALYNGTPSASSIVDFVPWCSDGSYSGGVAHDYAVSAGIWDSGDYFDIYWRKNGVLNGESIGRDKYSSDTNKPSDWDNHGGAVAYFPTPGASNTGPLYSVDAGIKMTQTKVNHVLVLYGFNIINASHTNIQESEAENDTFVNASHYFVTESDNTTVMFNGTGVFHWFGINSTSWKTEIRFKLYSDYGETVTFNYSKEEYDLFSLTYHFHEKLSAIYSTENANSSYQEDAYTTITQTDVNTFHTNITQQIINDAIIKNIQFTKKEVIHSDTQIEVWKDLSTTENIGNDTSLSSHYNTYINPSDVNEYESIFDKYTITKGSDMNYTLDGQGYYKTEKVSDNYYNISWNYRVGNAEEGYSNLTGHGYWELIFVNEEQVVRGSVASVINGTPKKTIRFYIDGGFGDTLTGAACAAGGAYLGAKWGGAGGAYGVAGGAAVGGILGFFCCELFSDSAKSYLKEDTTPPKIDIRPVEGGPGYGIVEVTAWDDSGSLCINPSGVYTFTTEKCIKDYQKKTILAADCAEEGYNKATRRLEVGIPGKPCGLCEECDLDTGKCVPIECISNDPCVSCACYPGTGCVCIHEAGCDHMDDSFDVSTPSTHNIDSSSSSEIGVLANGFAHHLLSLLDALNQPGALVDISLEGLNNYSVLVIPSGGLYGLGSSPTFKSNLDQYVKNGGTLIFFGQQHGYEFNALPGGEVSGYGWLEDQSCHHGSVGISTYRPILSGQDSVTSSVNVDGYFTKYPENATILLSRTKNGQPAMLMYKYGKGTVIATTAYTDWAYTHYQATRDGKNLIRDMIAWAKDPKDISDFASGGAIDIPVEVTNNANETADKVVFTVVDPDKNVFDYVNVSTTILPEETKTITFTYTAPSKLGIWWIDCSLYNSSNVTQTVYEVERFAISKYAENPEGFVYQGSEISFDITAPDEYVPAGSDVTFFIHIYNNGEVNKSITVKKDWNHVVIGEESVSVPAYNMSTITHTRKASLGRFWAWFSEGDAILGRASKGIRTFAPTIYLNVETDKQEYARGEDVSLLLNLMNRQSVSHNTTVTVRALDPDNKKIYEDSFNVNLSAGASETKTLDFTLPSDAGCGISLVTAEAYDDGNKIGSDSAYFEVRKDYIAELRFDKPDKAYNVRQNMSVYLNITNVGAALWTSTVNISIPDLAFEDSKFVVVNPKETEKISYNLSIPENLTTGKHDVIVTIGFDNSEMQYYFVIPDSNLILSSERRSYNAGEYLYFNLTNIGGVDTTCNCSIKFYDSRGLRIYGNDTHGTIFAGGTHTHTYKIPVQAVSGNYYLMVSCKDLNTSKITKLSKSYTISGLNVALTSVTDKKVYSPDENISILTNITNLDGAITNGSLNLKIVCPYIQNSASKMPSSNANINRTARLKIVEQKDIDIDYNYRDSMMREPYHDQMSMSINESEDFTPPLPEHYNFSFPFELEPPVEEELNESSRPQLFSSASMEIRNETVWKDEVKILNDNLIINSTGNLSLINTTLIMNCSSDGEYRIEVQNGGEMHILDKSNITAMNPLYAFCFQVYSGSTFEMSDSELHGCGYKDPYYFEPYGLWINTNDAIIENNSMTDNYYGIILYQSSNSTIVNNDVSLCYAGISLGSSSNNNITGNTASSNRYGISLGSSSNNNMITGNTASSNSYPGISLGSSSNNNITGNNASSNRYGIYLYRSSNNNSITGNNASSNSDHGISLSRSSNNSITGNNASSSSVGISLSLVSNNNSITGNNASSSSVGIYLYTWSNNNNITGNNASSNSDHGISLSRSSNNNITGNNASSNSKHGISLSSSSNNNMITGNNASSSSVGISLSSSSNNNITGNNASSNSDHGICLWDSSNNNSITGNNASSNTNHGIFLYSSSNNLIYNNYVKNTKNALDNSNNIWNRTKTPGTNIVGGPWLGGNYWSDYNGTDVDGDGLGDTLLPYNCSGNIIHGGDYLPLIKPKPPIGKTIWETNITIDMAPNETKNIITVVPLDMLNDMTGKVELISTLYSDLGQIIAYEDPFFYITGTNRSLILETDKRVYKPNETIAIYGEVKNHGSQPEGYNLSIKKNGAELFADVFTLNPNETHEFALNTSSNTSFTLEGTVDGVTVTDFVNVETASINVSVITPDVAGISPFNVAVLIENTGNISADLNVKINRTWDITIPEGESRLFEETTMSITKNTTLNVTISGDVHQTYQKEIFCGENARINITPESTYLEGTVDIPYIIENFGPLDSEFNATFSIDDQTILESFFVPKGQNITDSVSFNLTIGSHLLQYFSPFEVVNTTINVLSAPEFVVTAIYSADRNFTIGEDVTLVIEVENIGGSEGEAMLSLEMPDFEDTNRTWIRAGAKEYISFNLTIPDDLEEKNYKGFYELDGKRAEFIFFVQGANISVDASLDKSMYAEGDTAVLTLELTNECELDLDLYSRVKFNEYDSVQNYTLPGSDTETFVFYVPVNFIGDNKMLYTVYMDSGRSLYINSIYVYEKKPDVPMRLYTDKDVYNMGESVTIHIVDVTKTDVLNLTAPNFTYNDTLSGPAMLEFTLPELISGTYYIDYTFGNFSSAHPFDVRGYSARIIEAGLDKEVYYNGDIIKLKMNVEANRNVSGLQKTWIYDPENELVDEFAMNKTLMGGENEIEISRTLSTDISGIHVIVYGFSAELSGDSFTMLVSGAEYFDAEAVGLCGDVAPYPDCNGIVDMGDVILLLNNVSYPENPRYALCNAWAGDCRCNGVRDMGDVILLLNNVSYPEDPRYVLDCC